MAEVGERELLAIIFTDAVDSTARTASDEDYSLRILLADLDYMRNEAAVRGGTVLKNTGDGLLISFKSAVDAVECALSIQRGFANRAEKVAFQHKIGVHIGDVIKKDGDIYGNGVNTASRLVAQCPAGGICISSTLYELVKQKSQIGDLKLESFQLSNIEPPIGAYRLKNIIENKTNIKINDELLKKQNKKTKTMPVILSITGFLLIGIWFFLKKEAGKNPDLIKTNDLSNYTSDLICRWDFNDNSNDSISSLKGQLIGGAKIRNGLLVLMRKGSYMKSEPLPFDIEEKTIFTKVFLNNLDVRGGGVVSIEYKDGKTFDAIVFGEQNPKIWINGSEWFIRTDGAGGVEENSLPDQAIYLAATYKKDGTIGLYRNGEIYRKEYDPGVPLQKYQKIKTDILVGKRKEWDSDNLYLKGSRVDLVEVYRRALSSEEIKNLFQKRKEEEEALKKDNIVGRWRWFSGCVISFDKYGFGYEENKNSVYLTYEVVSPEEKKYKILWFNAEDDNIIFTDNLYLKDNGTFLEGDSVLGQRVSATKL